MRISDWSSDVCSSDLGRDVHFIAFLGAGGLLRRTGNGGEHRGDGGHGNETQSRTHITLPVAEDAPADDATDSCFCLAILYAREERAPSAGDNTPRFVATPSSRPSDRPRARSDRKSAV